MDHDDVAEINETPPVSSRRATLRWLAAMPAAGGLAALLAGDGEARRRKHRRRARRRRDDRDRKPRKKRCRNKAQFCAARCGPHKKKRCKKPVDCGPCRVFVSSSTHTGNLGGLSGADTICQSLATTAGLTGTYKAWLSDDSQSPSTRFATSTGAYALVNGATIASSWADLTDGELAAPVAVTEQGAVLSDNALRSWTNTLANGTRGGVFDVNCNGWTTGAADVSGDGGQVTSASVNWTRFTSGTCNNSSKFHLYCFQQTVG
ncbi:MAG: DUF1554 domain-containing protein [Thermomicrobiales bacterium]